jgi:SAM-dependent methyltransferase
MPSLLLGCGNRRIKQVALNGAASFVEPLITLDMNPNCGADVVHDLESRPLPFPDDYFDELAAYDVLEHIGRQGDWRGFFDEFAEYWRILKPGGTFGIVVPIGPDYHADPGHTRFFGINWFGFLDQDCYVSRLTAGEPVTDYRWYWKRNFELQAFDQVGDHHLAATLMKK